MGNQNHEIIQAQEDRIQGDRIRELEDACKDALSILLRMTPPVNQGLYKEYWDIRDRLLKLKVESETHWDKLELERRQGK